MSDEDNKPYHSTDCDEWEPKTVDPCDSVGVVTEGKDRKRIDKWRSMCKLLEIDAIEGTEEDQVEG